MELSSDYKIDKDSVLESKIFEDKKIKLAQEKKQKETAWNLHTLCAEFVSTDQMSSVKSLESQHLE